MLYAPAPQTVYDDSRPIERIFAAMSREPVPEASVEERLVKEIRFDPDAWIVETEDKAGRHFPRSRGYLTLRTRAWYDAGARRLRHGTGLAGAERARWRSSS